MYINVYHPFTALITMMYLTTHLSPFYLHYDEIHFFFLLTTHHIPSNFVYRVKRRKEDNSTMRIGKKNFSATKLLFLTPDSSLHIPSFTLVSFFPFSSSFEIFIFDYVCPFLMEKRWHFNFFFPSSALSFSYPIFPCIFPSGSHRR